jgi:hypothetical protein
MVTRRTAARVIFIIGLVLMIFGTAFLIGSLAGISRISILVSFFFVILGVIFAVSAIKLHKRSLYLFFAVFFLLVGFFLFLSILKIIPVPFSRGWPLLSVFSGLALLPSGWHRYGRFRSSYVVSSVFFVGMGSFLMVFSLDLVDFSFAQFMLNWWPLLVVLAGLTLVLISLGTGTNAGGPPAKEDTKR